MNNKGFAITTLVYGLAIMGLLLIAIIMATLSSTRRSVRDMSDKIEEELLNYSKSSVFLSSNRDENQNYTVPKGESGFYRIELWGGRSDYRHNNGDYTTGIIYLKENETLHFYLGRSGWFSFVAANTSDTTNSRIMYAAGGEDGCEASNISGYPGSSYVAYTSGSRKFYFVDGYILKGASTGEGKAKITKISSEQNIGNYHDKSINGKYWNEVTNIKVKTEGTDAYSTSNPCKVYYSYEGRSHVTNVNSLGADGYYNISITTKDIDDIIFYCPEYYHSRNTSFKVIIKGHDINMNSREGSVGTIIYNGKYDQINRDGVKLSAYQPNSTSDKPKHGTYYIIPLVDKTKAITANKTTDAASNALPVTNLDGSNRQRWSIDLVVDTTTSNRYYLYKKVKERISGQSVKEFKIVETTANYAMDIKEDDNIIDNSIAAKKPFNTISRNDPQIWSLIPNRDGTYTIKTSVPSSDPTATAGYITYNSGTLKIGKIDSTPTNEQKFILYSIDNSF